jgi:hypothetical protein
VWERAESRRFLTQRTGERDEAMLDEIADALGDLPLALEQSAAYSTANAITLKGYAERLRDRAPELFSMGRPLGYEHTVATVWQLAFEQIAQDAIADQLLGVCSLLAPERIPRELLEAAARVDDRELPGQRVDQGSSCCWATRCSHPPTSRPWTCIAWWGRSPVPALTASPQAHAAAAAAAALAAVWPEQPWEHEQWPACERLLAHALAASEHSQLQDVAPEQTATVLARVGRYQQARAQLSSAQQLTQRALVIKEAVYGPSTPRSRAHSPISAPFNASSGSLKRRSEPSNEH